jgi:alpha-D-ribose 1-methylphosphonate 5-triphosphate diphosphatase PhnM
MNEIVFKNASIVLPSEIVRGSVLVTNGLIKSIDLGQTNIAACD